MTQFWFAGSTEQFMPSEMLDHAQEAERAGFDALAASDHFAPWWPEGKGTQSWVTLAAIGQKTTKPIGTSVTPVVHHYHPGVVAQAFMALEDLYPGRVFLGVGSGESVNEVPLGADWPSVGEQIERMDKGLEAITRLWDGETVTMDGGWFKLKEAKLYTRAKSKPKLYVSAFGPRAAKVAAKYADGLWTLGDPESAPEIIDAYRSAGGRGEIILQAGFSLGTDEEATIAGARMWKATQLPDVYKEEIPDPADMLAKADAEMSDEEFAKEGFLVGADPDEQIGRIREMEEAGGTVICLQVIGADPVGSIRRYGEHVLPALRG
ncbi:MAG TPA: TIGR03557 family F420-dependent LLM class oxidoreductase [Solirubrobacteraceae bacterium]|nr:TIGR03557 family F420-dependent LLM class oxidoreductase [Solirubrobacteraceae bacterium]